MRPRRSPRRTTATQTTYAYDRTGVLLSRYDTPTTTYYAYDAFGNQTSNASAVNQNTTSTYDLADRLLTIVLPGPGNTTTAFTLDALGRIATRTPPGGAAETYAYLGTSETVWQISATVTTSAALDPGGHRVATGSGGVTGFTLPDLHANLAVVTDSAETAIASATRYDPFGLTVATYDSGGAFPTPWKFQGRLDVSANPADPLYEFSARFYQPATATFSQLDSYAGSVADPLSLNRYLYAAANPWTLIDPTGHVVLCGVDGGCGGGSTPPPISPPTSGFQEGSDPGSVGTPDPDPFWDQHTTDFYYDASWDIQDYLIDTHGSEALALIFGSDNPWDGPFVALLAREYIRKKYGLTELGPILLARLKALLEDVGDDRRAAAMTRNDEGNQWFWAELAAPIVGPGFDELGQRFGSGPRFVGSGGGPSHQNPWMTPSVSRKAENRGWTSQSIQETINNPSSTVQTTDYRWRSGGRNNEPATAFVNADGSYVVRNDRTGEIIQVSNRNDPNWRAPWNR